MIIYWETLEKSAIDPALIPDYIATICLKLDASNDPLTGELQTQDIYIPNTYKLFLGGAKIERVAGNIVLTPEASKLVKIAALRQDITTDSYKNNSVILTGWGFIAGAAAPEVSGSVTFGITFLVAPIVVAVSAGYRDDSNPTGVGDGLAASAFQVSIGGITTTGFNVKIGTMDGINIGASRRTLYTWIAIGALG